MDPKHLFLIGLLPVHGLIAQTNSPVTVQLQPVVSGLIRITDIAHCGDDRIFCALQAGTIRIVQNGNLLPTPFLNITSQVLSSGNEQGLLGLCFDPDYANNGYFYVNYTTGSGSGTTRVSRFSVSTIDPNVADPSSEVVLYSVAQPYGNHNGGDLDFGPDGYLYVALGDGGSANDPQNLAQNLGNAHGSILRIDVHGGAPYSIPPDNPFVNTPGALPEIWAYGLRNPWRFGFDRLTGDLWLGDVGQNAWEEVDFWPAGDNSGPNFGWRCREGLVATPGVSQSGCGPASSYVSPVQVHPNGSNLWCSVIGGRVYRGTQFNRLQGRYIYTDYCYGRFYSLLPDGSGGWVNELLLTPGQSSISCIGEDASGELYCGRSSSTASSSILYRIVDPCPMAPPQISQVGYILTSTPAVAYAWYLNGQPIPGATGQSIEATQDGTYVVQATFAGGCQFVSDPVVVTGTAVAGTSTDGVRIFPVPADEVLMAEGLPVAAFRLVLFDAAGRVAAEVPVDASEGRATLATRTLPAGAYVLAALTADGGELLRRPVTIAR